MSDTGTNTDHFERWRADEAIAEAMIPLMGRLYRENDIILYVFGKKIARTSIDIMKAHRAARNTIGRELSVQETMPILVALTTMQLDSAKIDLGKLVVGFEESDGDDLEAYLSDTLADILTGHGRLLEEPTDVVLYGFGRIGRLLARILIERAGSGAKLRLRAIVLRPQKENDVEKRASLLRLDSIHGPFAGTVVADEENHQIIINGNPVRFIYAQQPEDIDYTEYGIKNAIVIDNTGAWRDKAGLGRHLEANGATRAVLTAPGKGEVKNIIYGVNHGVLADDDTIVSAASCTTNAIVPPLKVMNDTFGIVGGHVETIHAYTNDQNLTDNFHKKERRGRSAPLNMVITETGAAKAVIKALPELAGKLTGNAIRVPVPNVSLAILNLTLENEATVADINAVLRGASMSVDLGEQIAYETSTEIVSSDLVGMERTSVVDSQATLADRNRCVLYVWYDNEAGYSYQVVRLVQELAGLAYPRVP
ncbi:MAG: glyceraldehyde-3-phosphate dehydrogenase [Actinomycetota bacterium]